MEFNVKKLVGDAGTLFSRAVQVFYFITTWSEKTHTCKHTCPDSFLLQTVYGRETGHVREDGTRRPFWKPFPAVWCDQELDREAGKRCGCCSHTKSWYYFLCVLPSRSDVSVIIKQFALLLLLQVTGWKIFWWTKSIGGAWLGYLIWIILESIWWKLATIWVQALFMVGSHLLMETYFAFITNLFWIKRQHIVKSWPLPAEVRNAWTRFRHLC